MEPNYNCSVQHASIKQVKVCLATAKIEIIYFVRIIRNSKVFKIEKLMSGSFLKKLYETLQAPWGAVQAHKLWSQTIIVAAL